MKFRVFKKEFQYLNIICIIIIFKNLNFNQDYLLKNNLLCPNIILTFFFSNFKKILMTKIHSCGIGLSRDDIVNLFFKHKQINIIYMFISLKLIRLVIYVISFTILKFTIFTTTIKFVNGNCQKKKTCLILD